MWSRLVEMWCKILLSHFIFKAIVAVTNRTCPHPDNYSDIADVGDPSISRPSATFPRFSATDVGMYNVTLTWVEPEFGWAHNSTPLICHYKIIWSYSPPQKGSSLRTHTMNINSSMMEAELVDLTPDTNTTVQLSACLMVNETSYICTEPSSMVIKTRSNPACLMGLYRDRQGYCRMCNCNNNTLICENNSGRCLDCLNGSAGNRCEICLSGFSQTLVDGVYACVQPTSGRHDPTFASAPSRVAVTSTLSSSSISVVQVPITSAPRYTESWPDQNPVHQDVGFDSKLTVIVVLCVTAGVVLVLVMAALIYRKVRHLRKVPVQFWTIQLQNENDSVAFSEMPDGSYAGQEDRLIENDFSSHRFDATENPYQSLTATT